MSRARSVANLGNQNVLDLNASTGSLSVGSGTTIENSGEAQFAGIVTAVQFSGDIIGVAATFSGNVSVAGTLTYEDVTSIDSVGVITARSGIDVGTGASISSPANNTLVLGTNDDPQITVDGSGRLLINTTTSRVVGGTGERYLQLEGTGFEQSSMSITRHSSSANGGPNILFGRSRGTEIGESTVLQNNDKVGSITWAPADGTDMGSNCAIIEAYIDGNVGVNSTPGALVFKTSASDASVTTERLRINSQGKFGFGISDPAATYEFHQPTYDTSSDKLAAVTIGTSSTITAFVVEQNGQVSIGKSNFNGDQMVSIMTNSGAPVSIYTKNFTSSEVAGSIYSMSSPDNYSAQKGELLIEGTQAGRVKEEGQAWGIRFHQGDGGGTDLSDRCTAAIHAIRETSTDGSTSLSFKTRSGVSNMDTRLLIKSGGHIGIGSTTPRTGLDLHRSTESACRISFSKSGSVVRNNYIGLDADIDSMCIAVDDNNQGDDSYFNLRIDGNQTINALDKVVNIGNSTTWSGNAYIDASGSVAQQASGSNGHGSISAPWVYTSAIEAVDERGTGSCGITLGEHGASNETTGSGDNIIMWTGGVDRLTINSAGTVTIPGTLNVRTAIDLADDDQIRLGSADDAKVYHDGSHLYIDMNNDDDIFIRDVNSSNNICLKIDTSARRLYVDDNFYCGYDGADYNTGATNSMATYQRSTASQGTDTWTSQVVLQADPRSAHNNVITAEPTHMFLAQVKNSDTDVNAGVADATNTVISKLEPSGAWYSIGSLHAGRSRTSTTSSPTNHYYPYTSNSGGNGVWAYAGMNRDSTLNGTNISHARGYRAVAYMRCRLDDTDDSSVFHYADSGSISTQLPVSNNSEFYHPYQTLKMTGTGRIQSLSHNYIGRVESEVNGSGTPVSRYASGERGMFLYAVDASNETYLYARNVKDTSPIIFSEVGSDTVFQVTAAGNATADGSFTGGGADYAEYFEWEDGNPTNENRKGTSVVLVGDKIRPATSSDDPSSILGIVSINPTVVGDGAELGWNQMYQTDEFGEFITTENTYLIWFKGMYEDETQEKVLRTIRRPDPKNEGAEHIEEEVMAYPLVPVTQPDPNNPKDLKICERMLLSNVPNAEKDTIPSYAIENNITYTTTEKVKNPDYDPDRIYIPRKDRKEWSAIGLMGKLAMKKGQPTGDRWVKLSDMSENVERWLVR